MVDPATLKPPLERLRKKYNDYRYVSPDPIEIPHAYSDPADIEVAGLIAASLAFGNVKTILASARNLLGRLKSPAAFIDTSSRDDIRVAVQGFRHRYVAEPETEGLIWAIHCARRDYGSLNALFADGYRASYPDILPALDRFCVKLLAYAGQEKNYLIPQPRLGSACKRWHMYLRWMIRRDAIDFGIWRGIPASKLVMPIDTHVHRVTKAIGFTNRLQADGRCAAEVTAAFRKVAPRDPVRYDFALSRLGIRSEASLAAFLDTCGIGR